MLLCGALVISSLILRSSSSVKVSVVFPLHLQYPPVAVIDESFSFTFSSSTFSVEGADANLKYELTKAPTWLALNETTRTIFGKPSSTDLGHTQIELGAFVDGTIAIDTATLLVIENNSLSGNYEVLASQLSRAGPFSVPSTLILHPSDPFQIAFGHALFNGCNEETYYHSVSVDNTPLPAWISFDSDTLSVSGTTPSLLTPQASPQTYSFVIAASQIAGFSQTLLEFEIVVTNRVLAFDQAFQTIHVVEASAVYVPSLLGHLHLDGQPVSREAIQSISTSQPQWLTLEEDDISFNGTAPSSVGDTSFQVSVVDYQTNSASIEIRLLTTAESLGYEFDTVSGPLYCVRGKTFEYQVTTFGSWQAEYRYTAELGTAKSWLSFAPFNMTLAGLVPVDIPLASFNISIMLLDDDDPIGLNQIQITVMDNIGSIPSRVSGSVTGIATSPSKSGTTSSIASASVKASNRHFHLLALVVALPTSLTFVSVLLLMCLSSKRRSRNRRENVQDSTETKRQGGVQNPERLVNRQTRSEELTMSNFETVISRPETSRNPQGQSYEEHNQRSSGRSLGSPETLSSWDEILNDLEALQRNPERDKVSSATSNEAPNQYELHNALHLDFLQPSRKSGHRLLSIDHTVARQSRRHERLSHQSVMARRSSAMGLGHGIVLSPVLGQTPMIVPVFEQHRRQSEMAATRRFTPSVQQSNNRNQMSRVPQGAHTNVACNPEASLTSRSSYYEIENSSMHDRSFSSVLQPPNTTSEVLEDHNDEDWVTEAGTIDSNDQCSRPEQQQRIGILSEVDHRHRETGFIPGSKQKADRMFVTSKSIESGRSEKSQARSLRFL